MKWISVNERMPAHGVPVLVTYADESGAVEAEIDYLDSDVDLGFDFWSNYGEISNVTHWCQIPRLPDFIKPEQEND